MKSSIVFLLVISLFVGFSMNTPASLDNKRITQDMLDDFEGEIIIKGNEFSVSSANVEENIFNKAGKSVEKVIDSSFDFLFDIVKGFIDD